MKPYYAEAGIEIYLGDCAEIAPQLGRFDLLCTDPPYGIRAARTDVTPKKHGRSKTARRAYGISDWDDAPAPTELIAQLIDQSRYQCIWGGQHYPLRPERSWLVWDKRVIDKPANDHGEGELAWTNYDAPLRIKRYLWNGYWQQDMTNKEPRYHPTQKPLSVMSWAIGLCPERPTTVLDPFMGSGTTLVACKNLGIRAVGIERERKYVDIAIQRLAQQTLDLGAQP